MAGILKQMPGAAVRAVFNGEVTNISDVSGTYLVIIKHGEYFTAYSNLRSYNVKERTKGNYQANYRDSCNRFVNW